MQDIMPNYQYKPLQHEDSIRLLSLRPSSADSSPITCTIRHVRLTEVVSQYEAISYTWGNVAQRQSIFVDHGESELQVGPSCYSALRNLRKKNYNRDIWIDAICIDQENLEERSKQVRIMDSIYRQASRVIAYLGEETTGSRVLFQELAEVDASLSVPSTATLTRERPKETVSQELASLFERPWFRRVWVLQEAHVNKVLFMCGSIAASWSALVECLWGYQDHEIPALAFRMQWRKPVIYSDARFTLWGLLYDSRHCLATDPRDKVFALRSLMGNQKAELDKLVDYTRSVEQTFIRTAEFLLPALGLHLLTAVRHPHSFLMPSWIPDFAQHLPLHTKFFKLSFWEHLLSDIRLNAIRGPYRVRGSFHNGSESLRMHVRGLRLAVIRCVSGRFTFSCLNDAGKQMKELYYYLPNLRELFIPINDSVPDGRSLESFSNQLGRIITEALSQSDPVELHCFLCRGRDSEHELEPSSNFWDPTLGVLLNEFYGSVQQTRIALMDNENIAIVPDAAQNGDIVCVFNGLSSVCVLRPLSRGDWRLISGDCAVFDVHAQTYYEYYAEEIFRQNDCALENFIIH